MREIKFRWISSEDYQMEYDSLDLICAWDNAYRLEEDYRKKDTPVMLNTGLKDKNGVEIYEGDIVSYGKESSTYLGPDPVGVIKFFNGCFVVMLINKKLNLSQPSHINEEGFEAEVIGNIYENPELLGE